MQPIISRDSRNALTLKLLNGRIGASSRLLDCGSRDGSLLRSLQDAYGASKLMALDYHNRVENGVEFLSHDLNTSLPFAACSFDVVICNDVLEHVENKRRLVSELLRVAKGQVVISLPNTQHWRYIRGLIRGKMSKQYNFLVDDGVDRHRWITYYEQNKRFIESCLSVDWGIENCMENTPEKKVPLFLVRRLRRFFVFNQIFLLTRVR